MVDLDPIQYMIPWDHPSQHPEQHQIGSAVLQGSRS